MHVDANIYSIMLELKTSFKHHSKEIADLLTELKWVYFNDGKLQLSIVLK